MLRTIIAPTIALSLFGSLLACDAADGGAALPDARQLAQEAATPALPESPPAVPPDAVPSCGDRLSLDLPWKPILDFGKSAPRGHWLLEGEDDRPDAAPILARDFFWLSSTPSALPLQCAETPDTCVPGGSRIALADGAGRTLAVHTHWRAEQLPEVPRGARVQLTLLPATGQLVVHAEDGSLLLGIVRYGGHGGYAPRAWQFGSLRIHSGDAICTATDAPCNYRDTLQSILVEAGAQRVAVAPAQTAQVTVGSLHYQVVNHAVVQHGVESPDRASCAARRPGLDSISIVRSP